MLKHLLTLSKSSLLLTLFILTTLQPTHISGQPPTKPTYFIDVCQAASGNYSTDSAYERKLKQVLSDLQNQSTISFSYTTTKGQNKSLVHAQFYCRGDIDSNLCSNCINQATQTLLKNCSHFRAAIIWYEECTLQYGDRSMAAPTAEYPRSWSFSDANVSDTSNFGVVLGSTVDRIINESTNGNGSIRFATGDGVVSKSETVYCLVQCRPALNGAQCETCLKSAFSYVPSCCGKWAKSVFVFYPSCQLRYSTEGKFYGTDALPSPVQPPPPPPPPTVTGDSTAVESRESVKFGLLVAAVAFLIFRPTS